MKKSSLLAIIAVMLFSILTGGPAMALELTSSSFSHEGAIPSEHTCDGSDRSPALSWKDAPAGTKSFALIADDPDAPAGTWVHWVAWNIPAQATSLAEGVKGEASLPDGSRQGLNDFKRAGYGGPCPPSGTHRYFFKLYALDTLLSLPATATKSALVQAMKGHMLAEATLMGTYSRSK